MDRFGSQVILLLKMGKGKNSICRAALKSRFAGAATRKTNLFVTAATHAMDSSR
jgi:hypothetical protein